MKKLLELGQYASHYKLPIDAVTIESTKPEIDVNQTGLLMHGSLADPYLILKHGLKPQETPYCGGYRSQPQICLGLNNTNSKHTIHLNGSMKNTAVKYADYFKPKGVVYILDPEVAYFLTYRREEEDIGNYKRATAIIKEPVEPKYITALVSRNIPLVIAAMLKAKAIKPILLPDGRQIKILEEK